MPRTSDPDRPKKVNISARIDPHLLERIEAMADADERSVSYFVEKALREWLDLHAPKRGEGAASADRRRK